MSAAPHASVGRAPTPTPSGSRGLLSESTTSGSQTQPPHPQSRQYRFVSLLGSGGFGEVYLAEAISTGFRKPVAIKILKREWADHPEIRGRLADEAAMLGLLRHPNIVSAENFSVLDGQPALVMEYVPGITLLDAIKMVAQGHPPGVRAIAEVGAAIASALDAAYWRPATGTQAPIAVLHRDVKPGNVRLTPHGEVKLLDFGIACSEVLDRSVETTQSQPGSLSYMAPELLQGRRASPASDVYSLGVVLMEGFSCKRFGWAGASAEEHATKLSGALQRLTHVPAPFVALLAEVLAYDPQRRPLAADLMRACRGLARSVGGPDLREWCEAHAHGSGPSAEPRDGENKGQLIGRVFIEETGTVGLLVETDLRPQPPPPTIHPPEVSELSSATLQPPINAPAPSIRWVAGALGLGLLGCALATVGVLYKPDSRPPEIEFVFQSAPPEPSLPAAAEPVAAIPKPPPPPQAEPRPVAPPPASAPAPLPAATTPSVTPRPKPAPPAATPRRIKLSSVPLGLPITVDGRRTGKKTPAALTLTAGRHRLRFGDGPSVRLTVPETGRDLFTYDQLSQDWRK